MFWLKILFKRYITKFNEDMNRLSFWRKKLIEMERLEYKESIACCHLKVKESMQLMVS